MEKDTDFAHRIAERSLGCKIEDLKFVVPMSTLPLGGTFWKNGTDTVLCDVDANSVFASVRLSFSQFKVRPTFILGSFNSRLL